MPGLNQVSSIRGKSLPCCTIALALMPAFQAAAESPLHKHSGFCVHSMVMDILPISTSLLWCLECIHVFLNNFVSLESLF